MLDVGLFVVNYGVRNCGTVSHDLDLCMVLMILCAESYAILEAAFTYVYRAANKLIHRPI